MCSWPLHGTLVGFCPFMIEMPLKVTLRDLEILCGESPLQGMITVVMVAVTGSCALAL